MSILWISDFFATDVPGGAELVDDIIISELEKDHEIKRLESSNVTLDEINQADYIFLSNFIKLPLPIREEILKHKYTIYEHDHKYLTNRDPSMFENFQAPPKYIANKQLYKNAQYILCQSAGHAKALQKNLFTKNILNLGGSLWKKEQYSFLKKETKNTKSLKSTKKYMVLDSPNLIKNSALAELYCKKNNLDYDLVSDSDWNSFMTKMSSYDGLVFFPKVYESFNRLVVEARMLGLEVITNGKVGATSEPWFAQYKGSELVEHLEDKRRSILKKIKGCINKTTKIPNNLTHPLVSIITSVYDGEEYVKSFMENITSQSYFESCELIIINANSPANEDDLFKPYLQKYNNISYERLDSDPGLYAVWNMAIERSKGKYITNANLDDRRALNQIEELVKVLEFNKEVDLVYTESYVTNKPGEDFYQNSSNGKVYSAKKFTKENMIKCLPGCMPVWRKSLHDTAGLFNEKYKSAGDWEMWLRAVRHGSTFKKVETPLGMYYFSPRGVSTSPERAEARRKEEKEIFVEYADIFGPINSVLYRGYFIEE